MQSKVSQTKLDKLMVCMRRDIPNLRIAYKDEPMPTWWLGALMMLVRLVGLIAPRLEEQWFTNYSNGIFNYLLLPSRSTHGDHLDVNVYAILRHEYVHMRDMRRHPVWFPLSYLLVLPTVLTMRAHWELRGYTQQMLVEYECTGDVSDHTLDWIAEKFTGAMYLWMWPFGNRVRSRLKDIRRGILKGEVQGFYPAV